MNKQSKAKKKSRRKKGKNTVYSKEMVHALMYTGIDQETAGKCVRVLCEYIADELTKGNSISLINALTICPTIQLKGVKKLFGKEIQVSNRITLTAHPSEKLKAKVRQIDYEKDIL